jgi:hypothetical protein
LSMGSLDISSVCSFSTHLTGSPKLPLNKRGKFAC